MPGRATAVRHGLRTAALGGAAGCAHPVAAHGGVPAGGAGFDVPVAVVIVATAGVLAGTGVVVARDGTATGRYARYLSRLVGPLLVCIGGLAALSALFRQPGMAAGGVAVGLGIGAVLATRATHSTRTAMTTGTIGLHRFAEGAALASLALVGPAVTALGVAVLAGHTALECVVVAGQRTRPVAAITAVCAVSGLFVLGAAAGAVGLFAVPVSRALLGAVLGGALLAFGLQASRPGSQIPACDHAKV